MYLLYTDESGSTGTNYDDPQQPIFSFTGICVEDCKWNEVNNKFNEEKVKIYQEFSENEIHACELFNPSKKSIYKKHSWKENLEALEKIVDLITSLDITIFNASLDKKVFKKYISNQFGSAIKIDPYLYAFGATYQKFNQFAKQNGSYGIIFSDEIKSLTDGIELLYPKLKEHNANIIESSLFLDSKKNNFIQMADVCAIYFNKYFCIAKGYHNYNDLKQNHCIKMYNKLLSKLYVAPQTSETFSLNEIDRLFK